MTKPFTLYWSNLALYEECPQKFLWGRGWGEIDLGNGPGRPKTPPIKRSEHHAIMGIVLADFWEALYNEEEWRQPGVESRLLQRAQQEFDTLCRTKFIDWRLAPPRQEMWATIEAGLLGYFSTMRAQKIIGLYARSEVDLATYVDQWTPIGGRADLIIQREDTGVTILDGKNSKRYKNPNKAKGAPPLITYTDPDQLRWYALCYYLIHGVMPDRLAFVYFRYPYGAPVLDENGQVVLEQAPDSPTFVPKREEGITFVPFDQKDLEGLATRAKNTLRGMRAEKFDATPSPSVCRMCDFETVCPQRQAQKAANRRTPRRKEAGNLPDLSPGLQTFTFGD